ncbi:50S ribosomal protein L29 [Pelagicoccus mobilis]|uniref:Large ribosomal subunit protein uL29 n=1 Tax=Pelagicoccus mobilis TaxID=415221 RepID=A0A934RUG6_9BACT|nr:50S ribosomal protein L29 [Pelagicoccus mobilis]MBK1877855.1 50S ribosomal protein L29 [Pelagicoccus mobilis]
MKTKDIKELSVAEIEKKLRDTREQLLDLKLQKQTGQVEKTHEITAKRKLIARLETIRNEKIAAEKKSA